MNDAKELLKKVRRIEIKTRQLSNHVFAGEYHSAFKGKGITFSEVREYQYGDDIRNMDWNITARFNHPYVKLYEEERELTIMLLLDMSGSTLFGTQERTKREYIAELAAVLSFSASLNNDKIGAILFTDTVEKFIPPKKGRKHILRIIVEILSFTPKSNKTNIENCLQFLTNAIKKRSTAFVISDFIAPDFESSLKIVSQKHDVIAIKVTDPYDEKLLPLGMVYFYNPETNETILIDTTDTKILKEYEQKFKQQENEHKQLFSKYRIDYVSLFTSQDYVKPLVQLFKHRSK